MWTLLQRNLTGSPRPRPIGAHPWRTACAGSWAIWRGSRNGHTTHCASRGVTRPVAIHGIAGARPSCSPIRRRSNRYRGRLAELEESDLARKFSYFARYDVTGLDLLKTHALHLAGHRFQVRYVRGTYSRAHGTVKADFDPW